MDEVFLRARRHAALGDAVRLTIVDFVRDSDRTVNEIREYVELGSSLLAHHLDVLEDAGLITRHTSRGDARRRYVSLSPAAIPIVGRAIIPNNVLFVCTENSARSQLASALWGQKTHTSANCAGTKPAQRVHPRTVEVGRRYGLDLREATPRALTSEDMRESFVVTVCDSAYEELGSDLVDSHWSIADPAAKGTISAFVDAIEEISQRITNTTGAIT